MLENVRSEFDIPRDVCYLKAAYLGLQPRRVLDAAIRGAEYRAQPWRVSSADFFTNVEALRTEFAGLIECSPKNIAIVPSASYGIANAANNITLAAGDSIITVAEQFPSNYYSWQRLAANAGGQVESIDKRPDQSWTNVLLERLASDNPPVRIAALPNHHWATGETIDLHRVCARLRELDAKIVLDLTQTIGVCPVDLAELDPDYVAIAGYKWLFCPYGVSFLYVADRNLEGVPIEENWAERRGSEDFSRLVSYTDEYAAGARRYDVGERASFSNIAGALESIRMLREWGVAAISAKIASTSLEISEILNAHGFATPDPGIRGPHIQCAGRKGSDMRAIAAQLERDGVFVSVRGDQLRLAPHIYNDEQDLARLRDSLATAAR